MGNTPGEQYPSSPTAKVDEVRRSTSKGKSFHEFTVNPTFNETIQDQQRERMVEPGSSRRPQTERSFSHHENNMRNNLNSSNEEIYIEDERRQSMRMQRSFRKIKELGEKNRGSKIFRQRQKSPERPEKDSMEIRTLKRSSQNLSKCVKNYEQAVLKQKEREQKEGTEQNMLKSLSIQMQIEKKHSSDKLESMEEQLETVNYEKSTFKQIIYNAKNKRQDDALEIAELKRRINKLERQKTDLKTENTTYYDILEHKTKIMGKLSQEVSRLKRVQSQIEQIRIEKYPLLKQLDDLTEEREELFEKLKYLITYCGQNEEEISFKTNKLRSQRQINQDLQQENQILREEKQHFKHEYQAQTDLSCYLNSQRTRLERTLIDQRRRNQELSTKIFLCSESSKTLSVSERQRK